MRGIQPVQLINVGKTRVSQEEFESWCMNNMSRFNANTYNLMSHNCNNFAHEAMVQGLGLSSNSMPQWILDVPNRVLSSPMGQMLRPMLDQMQMPAPFSDGQSGDNRMHHRQQNFTHQQMTTTTQTNTTNRTAVTTSATKSSDYNPWAHIPDDED